MTDYTRQDEDAEIYADRIAGLVSPAVRAEAEAAYGDDLIDAVPMMILLTVAEKIAALGGPVATTKDIDVYDLIYVCNEGTISVNNDEMYIEQGHVTVFLYYPNGDEARTKFTDLDQAASYVVRTIAAQS